jgi:hypothetical protein
MIHYHVNQILSYYSILEVLSIFIFWKRLEVLYCSAKMPSKHSPTKSAISLQKVQPYMEHVLLASKIEGCPKFQVEFNTHF